MGKIEIHIFKANQEPGVFFITDPFVTNVAPIETFDQLYSFYNKQRNANSDSLFLRILSRLNKTGAYMGREDIWREAFKTSEGRGGERGTMTVGGDSFDIIARLSQYYYRILNDRQGYYAIHDVSESDALKIATAFRDAYLDL